MNAIGEFFKTLGGPRLAAMSAVAVGLTGIFIFLIMRLSQPQMETLFSDLASADSGTIVRQLEAMNIPYEIRNDGNTVLVPKKRLLRLRMSLAEQGLPAGKTVGYEIFDKSGTLGATSFVQNINRLRALEGELARTIRSLSRVQMARVHLVLPKRQLFARTKAEPTASIIVRVNGSLQQAQINSIQHLVASAVEGLKPSHVSVVDHTGKLLASGVGDASQSALSNTIRERNLAFERRMKSRIEQIVGSIVGTKSIRVQVTAELDYNRITQTSVTYDPESQVVRSTQTREQKSSSAKGKPKTVSVGNELPAADAGKNNKDTKSSENANRTEEIVNYEISRTTKTEVIEAGRIKRISVAVLVDGIYNKGTDGKVSYAPRPKVQIDQIASLVRTSIGFNRTRGDQVEVANLRFAPPLPVAALEAPVESFLNLDKSDYFYIAELAVLLIIALLVLLMIVRPLVRRILTPDNPETLSQISDGSAPGTPGGVPQLTAPDGTPIEQTADVKALMAPRENKTAAMMDVAQMAGEMHEASIKKAGDIIQGNPDEAVAIVRQWLQEPASS